MSDLHTEYYNEVGCKYGLQRGIPYDELSPEERRGRRHKALGQRFRMIWDSNKSLSQELKVKDTVILEKDAKIKSLNAKVTTLTEEVNGLKYRLTLIDADAVDRLQTAKNAETTRADKAESELRGLRSDYERLSYKWNEIWKEPEYNDAAKMVKVRKEEETRLAEEAKREEQARENRRQSVLDSLVANGKDSLRSFALTDRIDFNEQEAKSIYYGIMAIAQKFDFDLCTKKGVSSAVCKFLDTLSWNGCTDFRTECVTNWTKLFAENNNIYDSHVINNFISFIDYMSCSAKNNVTTGGSNGCADQLTNWDGTQKIGLGALPKKKR